MTTWREMARANRTAAHELFAAKRWRSCVSRAYYAIYSEITRCLLKAKVSMPNGQANPKHKTLPTTIETRLTALTSSRRYRLSGLTRTIYNLRVIADYLPNVTLEEKKARICLGMMAQAFQCLKGIS